ncbi:death-associated protein 1 [Copidosoma floridanum]|uniref:death-associated protein 1 n=1 Tax=Copidosoma floridanum TaxID=29053 RepID=UPI0006C9AD0E|nr:death-associated protein 1 [Copidosoma floridanum]
MSSFEESNLKAGHPPAVKAGGMRITQHKNPDKEREVKATKDSEDSKTSSRPSQHLIQNRQSLLKEVR